MLNVKATCVKLHGFFHHITKGWLHVWKFMALGDSIYQDWGGIGNEYVYSDAVEEDCDLTFDNVTFSCKPEERKRIITPLNHPT